LLLGVLGAIFVITAIATGNRSVEQPTPSTVEANTPPVGSCVAVAGSVMQVSCDNPHALRVERHAPRGDDCHGGTVPLRWGRETPLCVRPPSRQRSVNIERLSRHRAAEPSWSHA